MIKKSLKLVFFPSPSRRGLGSGDVNMKSLCFYPHPLSPSLREGGVNLLAGAENE